MATTTSYPSGVNNTPCRICRGSQFYVLKSTVGDGHRIGCPKCLPPTRDERILYKYRIKHEFGKGLVD